MLGYTQLEKDLIVRSYFGVKSEQVPNCSLCGEDLLFCFEYEDRDAEPVLKISCPGCANGFTWRQTRAVECWRELHIQYFVERMQLGQPLICPFDDCSVTAVEFSDDRLEFRCFYCNRRGTVDSSAREQV